MKKRYFISLFLVLGFVGLFLGQKTANADTLEISNDVGTWYNDQSDGGGFIFQSFTPQSNFPLSKVSFKFSFYLPDAGSAL